MLVILAFVTDKLVIDAVLKQILLNDAFVDSWRVLLKLRILAFVTDKLVIDAVLV